MRDRLSAVELLAVMHDTVALRRHHQEIIDIGEMGTAALKLLCLVQENIEGEQGAIGVQRESRLFPVIVVVILEITNIVLEIAAITSTWTISGTFILNNETIDELQVLRTESSGSREKGKESLVEQRGYPATQRGYVLAGDVDSGKGCVPVGGPSIITSQRFVKGGDDRNTST